MHKPKAKDCVVWLFSQIRHRIPSLLLLMFSGAFSAYLGVIFSVATKDVIDNAVSGTFEALIRSAIFLAILILMRIVFNALSLHLNERLTADFDKDFKRNIMHKIFRSDFSEISKFHSGELVHRMNGDVHTVYAGILSIVTTFSALASALITAIVVLLQMAPLFTVAIVVISAVIAFFTLLIQRKMKQLHKDASAATGKVSGFLQESVEKLLMVQALDVAPEVEKRADDLLEERWKIFKKRKNIHLSMNIGANVLSFAGGLITLLWCAIRLYHGLISYGELTAMTQLVSQLQIPMLTLPSLIPQFISIMAATERLMEIEAIPLQTSTEKSETEELYNKMTGITAKNLTFKYDRDTVINNASFTIPKGGLTVIVGSSGAGKSTILKLLLGIYKPNSGKLYVDTPDEKYIVSRSSRHLFSYAPQGNLLLSGTLRDNLLLSKPDATEDELNNAVFCSAMDEYMAELPDGLDTVLGENAAGISEGQAQRLSLARAILSGSPILLLDEVTSALDAKTEQIVLKRICSLSDRTCIAVTHRPAALSMADYKLTVSENGVTVEPVSK